MTALTREPSGLNIGAFLIVTLFFISKLVIAAPLQESVDIQDHSEGCYYNYNHYNEGDRISTNEPCLNCTCHNKMLMCYLRVCPFTKPIGHDCVVEKREDQCCPVITCPEVPVELSHQVEPGTELAIPEKYGCTIDNRFYVEGAQVPSNQNKPCELCYCIKNRTSCLMQECTLHIDGCQPIYNKDSCCPVRYNCDHENELLLDDSSITTTDRPTQGFLLTTTSSLVSADCYHDNSTYLDGTQIKTNNSCQNCYCMHGDIVCAVQKCEIPLMEVEGKICKAGEIPYGECCPNNYICEEIIDESTNALIPGVMNEISHEDVELQQHIDKDTKYDAEDYTKEELDITTLTIPDVNVGTEATIPIIANEDNSNKNIYESQEIKIKTELPLSLSTDDDQTNQSQLEDIPMSIPGEGSCLIDNETYSNNTRVATSNECEEYCTCISSVVICKPVECNLPQSKNNCSVDIESKFECCPVYICNEHQNIDFSNSDSTETQTTSNLENVNDILEITTLSVSQSSFNDKIDSFTLNSSKKESSHKTVTNLYTTSKYFAEDSGSESSKNQPISTTTSASIENMNNFEGSGFLSNMNSFEDDEVVPNTSDKEQATTVEYRKEIEGSGTSTTDSVGDDDEQASNTAGKSEAITVEYRKEIDTFDDPTAKNIMDTTTLKTNIVSDDSTSLPSKDRSQAHSPPNNESKPESTTSGTNTFALHETDIDSTSLPGRDHSEPDSPQNLISNENESGLESATGETNTFASHETDLHKQELSTDTFDSDQTMVSLLHVNESHSLSEGETTLALEVNSIEENIDLSKSENSTPSIKKENLTNVPVSDNLFVKEDSLNKIEVIPNFDSITSKSSIENIHGNENSIDEHEEQTTTLSSIEISSTFITNYEETHGTENSIDENEDQNKTSFSIQISSTEYLQDFKETNSTYPNNADSQVSNNVYDYGLDTTTQNRYLSLKEMDIYPENVHTVAEYNGEFTTSIPTITVSFNDGKENVRLDDSSEIPQISEKLDDSSKIPQISENKLLDIEFTTESVTIRSIINEDGPIIGNAINRISDDKGIINSDSPSKSDSGDKGDRITEGPINFESFNFVTTTPIEGSFTLKNDQIITTVKAIVSDKLESNLTLESNTFDELITTSKSMELDSSKEEGEEGQMHKNGSIINDNIFEDFTSTMRSIAALPGYNLGSEEDKTSNNDSYLSSYDIQSEEYMTTKKSVDQELYYQVKNGEDKQYKISSHLSSDHNKLEESITTVKSVDQESIDNDEGTTHKNKSNSQFENKKIEESPTTIKSIDSEDEINLLPEDVITTVKSVKSDVVQDPSNNAEIEEELSISSSDDYSYIKFEDSITTIKSIDIEPIFDVENNNRDNEHNTETSLKIESGTYIEELTTTEKGISSELTPNIEKESESYKKEAIESSTDVDSLDNNYREYITTVNSRDSVHEIDDEHKIDFHSSFGVETESSPFYESITTVRNVVQESENIEIQNTQKETTDSELSLLSGNVNNNIFEFATSTDSSEDKILNGIITTTHTFVDNISIHPDSYPEPEIEENFESVQPSTSESTNSYKDETHTTIKNEKLELSDSVNSEVEIDYSTLPNPSTEASGSVTEAPKNHEVEEKNTPSNSNNQLELTTISSEEKVTVTELNLEQNLQDSYMEKLGISSTSSNVETTTPTGEEELAVKTVQPIDNVTNGNGRISVGNVNITKAPTMLQNNVEDLKQPSYSQNIQFSDSSIDKLTTTTERPNAFEDGHNIYTEDPTTSKYHSDNKPLNGNDTIDDRNDYLSTLVDNQEKPNKTIHNFPTDQTDKTTSSPTSNSKITESSSTDNTTSSLVNESTYGSIPQSGMYAPPQYSSYPEDEYTDEDEGEIFGPGTCRYGGKLYVSAQQIPRDDPCDFCFCFRSDIICLQQSCPPPISGCREEPIHGFCCPRYECPVSMGTVMNITTSTTTTSTTLPPHFLSHNYQGSASKSGCFINGITYKIGDEITSSSGPCMECLCGGDGQMKCSPKSCSPEPLMRQMVAQAISKKR